MDFTEGILGGPRWFLKGPKVNICKHFMSAIRLPREDYSKLMCRSIGQTNDILQWSGIKQDRESHQTLTFRNGAFLCLCAKSAKIWTISDSVYTQNKQPPVSGKKPSI